MRKLKIFGTIVLTAASITARAGGDPCDPGIGEEEHQEHVSVTVHDENDSTEQLGSTESFSLFRLARHYLEDIYSRIGGTDSGGSGAGTSSVQTYRVDDGELRITDRRSGTGFGVYGTTRENIENPNDPSAGFGIRISGAF